MNKVVLVGRLTRDPEMRYSRNAGPVARYMLTVDRRRSRYGNEQAADFISCIAFQKNAEVAETYLRQGTKIVIFGHLRTGSYTDKNGQMVYTTDVVVDEQEFAESMW